MISSGDLDRIETVLKWAVGVSDALTFIAPTTAMRALQDFRALRPLLAFALGVGHEASEVVDL